MNIFPLYTNQVMGMWPLLVPYVESALRHSQGELTSLDICEMAMNGAMHLWVVAEKETIVGVAVTELVVYPQVSSLRIVTLGGEKFQEWRKDLDGCLDQFARIVGAKRIEAVGRFGWIRALKDLNYVPAYVIMTRPVGGLKDNEEALHEQVGRNH